MTSKIDGRELELMNRAIVLARRGQGRVEPNPMVGCVLVKGGLVIAEGYHRKFGGLHAEAEALHRAGRAAKGATVFVTLEPCSHFGKTPPCANALVDAGVKRVVVAMKDPFPEVAGRGIRVLRRAGIRVDVGLGRDQAHDLNAPYLTLLLEKRPYVILKWAQSIDGKIATHSGESKWISSPESRKRVHRLRARVDGVVVGINTVLVDDPRLTARDVPLRRTSARIVLDTRLRFPARCALAMTANDELVLVATSRAALRARARHARELGKRGVELLPCRLKGDRLDLGDVLRRLGRRGMTNLLVEGGSRVLTEFLDRRLADEVYAFVAPRLIGGERAPGPFAGRGVDEIAESLPAAPAKISRSGPDALIHLRLKAGHRAEKL